MNSQMNRHVNRLAGIPIAVSMALLVAAHALGASKSGKVVATRTVTGQPLLSRTFTARPADLDPRIPWLEDMGEPQSGGPEPFLLDQKIRYPLTGDPRSIVEQGDRLAVIDQHYSPSVGGSVFDLVMIKRTGEIVWSRSLARDVLRTLFWEGNWLYVIPRGRSLIASPAALVYDESGTLLRAIPCPLNRSDEFGPGEMTVIQGTAIWERRDGSRVGLKLGDGPGVDPDNVLLPSDINDDGGTGKLRLVPRRFAVDTDGHRNELAPGAKTRRAKRVHGWEGRELDHAALLRARAGRNGRLIAPSGAARPYVPWGDPGGILAFFGLNNPLNLSDDVYRVDWKHVNGRPKPVFDRDLAVYFDARGRLRGYLILVAAQASQVEVQNDSLYMVSRTGPNHDVVWLERWIAPRKP